MPGNVARPGEVEKKFLSCREVAEEYGGMPNLWRRLALEQEVPAVRIGAVMIHFTREDVEDYLAKNRVTGPVACRRPNRNGRRAGRPRRDKNCRTR